MQREIIRTIQSFLPPYQIGIDDFNIEIIVIDTGSKVLPDLTQFQDKVKFIQFKTKHPSPVEAVNYGINIASSNLVGVLIDGARMVTPGMCRDVINVNAIYDRVFISTLAFHLGPDVQMTTVFEGYNQDVEDKLLDELDWLNNGYDLYLTSELALSSINGLYAPIAESNAIFTDKKLWKELGGYDERFISIGGGISNLDLYKRAGELPNTKLIRLTSEATFHQVHGGVATNNKLGIYNDLFDKEYQAIHGVSFTACNKIPELYGKMMPQVSFFFSNHSRFRDNKTNNNDKSLSKESTIIFNHFKTIQSRLNKILKTMTNELYFKSTDVITNQKHSD